MAKMQNSRISGAHTYSLAVLGKAFERECSRSSNSLVLLPMHAYTTFPSGRQRRRSGLHMLHHGRSDRRQNLAYAVDPAVKVLYSYTILVMLRSSTINSRCRWSMLVNGAY